MSRRSSRMRPYQEDDTRPEADSAGLTGDEGERVERIEGRLEGLDQPVTSQVGRAVSASG